MDYHLMTISGIYTRTVLAKPHAIFRSNYNYGYNENITETTNIVIGLFTTCFWYYIYEMRPMSYTYQ